MRIFRQFSIYFIETISKEIIILSDIRIVKVQVDQYNFLDSDDIEKFNGYLYQNSKTHGIEFPPVSFNREILLSYSNPHNPKSLKVFQGCSV